MGGLFFCRSMSLCPFSASLRTLGGLLERVDTVEKLPGVGSSIYY